MQRYGSLISDSIISGKYYAFDVENYLPFLRYNDTNKESFFLCFSHSSFWQNLIKEEVENFLSQNAEMDNNSV